MPLAKKSKQDLEKLRKILDNPSDPSLKKIISPEDTELDSLRRRMAGETPPSKPSQKRTIKKTTPFSPTVVVYKQEPIASSYEPVPSAPFTKEIPSFTPISEEGIPEFTEVTSEEFTAIEEELYEVEDLYEIEKIEDTIPAFTEVSSFTSTVTQVSTPAASLSPGDEKLPEWEPVGETTTLPTQPQFNEAVIPPEPPAPEAFTEVPKIPESQPILLTQKEQKKLQKQLEKERKQQQKATKKQARQLAKLEARRQKEEEKKRKAEQRRQQKEEQKLKVATETVEQPVVEEPPKQTAAEKKKEKLTQQRARELEEKKQREELKAQQRAEKQAQRKQQKQRTEKTVNRQAPKTFQGLQSVDEKTAVLLYDHGYRSLDDLKKATIDELTSIQGIKRKHAKHIKKELQEQEKPTTAKKPSARTEDEEVTEWTAYHADDVPSDDEYIDVCTYGAYTLYRREVIRVGGKRTTIHFFSKEEPTLGKPATLPPGYRIAINKKTGIPYLKRKR